LSRVVARLEWVQEGMEGKTSELVLATLLMSFCIKGSREGRMAGVGGWMRCFYQDRKQSGALVCPWKGSKAGRK
jgi:hypothetical protein